MANIKKLSEIANALLEKITEDLTLINKPSIKSLRIKKDIANLVFKISNLIEYIEKIKHTNEQDEDLSETDKYVIESFINSIEANKKQN